MQNINCRKTHSHVFVHHGLVHGETELTDEGIAADTTNKLRRVLDTDVA